MDRLPPKDNTDLRKDTRSKGGSTSSSNLEVHHQRMRLIDGLRRGNSGQSDAAKQPEERESPLKSDVAKQIEELEGKLEGMFANQLKSMIPNGCEVKDLWRLCTDEKYQHEGPASSMDGKEPHFVVGIMKGFHLMLQGLGNKPLTPQYYEQMHDTCIKGDSAKAADRLDTSTDSSIQEGRLGKFIQDNAFSHLKLGYRFKDQVQTEYGPASRVSGYPITVKGYYSNAGITELCKNYEHRNGGDPRYPSGHPVGKALMDEPFTMIKDKYIAFKPLM
jgi:hypothetical protein